MELDRHWKIFWYGLTLDKVWIYAAEGSWPIIHRLGFCPESVRVKRLSNLCPIPHFSNYCEQFVIYVTRLSIFTVTRSLTWDQMLLMRPDTVDLRWVGNGQAVGDWPRAFGSINPDFVQSPSVSKHCPISVQFKRLKRLSVYYKQLRPVCSVLQSLRYLTLPYLKLTKIRKGGCNFQHG